LPGPIAIPAIYTFLTSVLTPGNLYYWGYYFLNKEIIIIIIISVLVQRFNAVLLHDSLPAADSTD